MTTDLDRARHRWRSLVPYLAAFVALLIGLGAGRYLLHQPVAAAPSHDVRFGVTGDGQITYAAINVTPHSSSAELRVRAAPGASAGCQLYVNGKLRLEGVATNGGEAICLLLI